MEKVGKEGVITVKDGKTLHDEVEIIEGMKFDQGFLSRYFITDQKAQKVEFSEPKILLFDGKISSIHPLLNLLNKISSERQKLVIFAENVEGDALATLILNKLQVGLSIVAVKAPGFGDNRKAILQDLAVLTGGTVISEEIGLKLEDVTMEQLGSCKTIEITSDDTLILTDKRNEAELKERTDSIREAIKRSTSDYEKEKFQERLAKLSGGVAVLKVGGSSEVEVSEKKKDRITDALNATKAAVEEGIVPGGGVALLYASRTLESLKKELTVADQIHGVDIIQRACRIPCQTIADNAGTNGAVVVEKLLQANSESFGFNAATGEYVDMIKTGIIDPTKVVRTALIDASGVASLMTTTEAIIVELPEDKKAPMGGGMGGMGGMGGEMF